MPVLNMRNHEAFLPAGTQPVPVESYRKKDYLRAVASRSGADAAASVMSAAHPILSPLTEQARRALSRWSRLRRVTRREVVCRQGDLADSVVLVMEGYLKRTIPLADGSEILLDVAGPGSCAGEMTVLQEQRRDADLTALSQCLLLMIDARQFRQAFDREPDGLLAIVRSTVGQLQRATEQLLDGRALNAGGRLAKVLLHLTRFSSSEPGAASHLQFRLSQSELGAMAGTSREVVNKHLGLWRSSGWIGMSGGTVTWVDTAAIGDMSRDEGMAGAGAVESSRDRGDRRRPPVANLSNTVGLTRHSFQL
jgi:CRP/FNR family cyclic AMP-dependent transcriptional regulator